MGLQISEKILFSQHFCKNYRFSHYIRTKYDRKQRKYHNTIRKSVIRSTIFVPKTPIQKPRRNAKGLLSPTPDQTFEIAGEGPYNFIKIPSYSRELQEKGDFKGACEERYRAFQRLAELLPEDQEINLEWNHPNSRAALELVHASAVDHFLINDFEMSAALLELLLDIDPEDHLEGSELLAFDYLAMDERGTVR